VICVEGRADVVRCGREEGAKIRRLESGWELYLPIGSSGKERCWSTKGKEQLKRVIWLHTHPTHPDTTEKDPNPIPEMINFKLSCLSYIYSTQNCLPNASPCSTTTTTGIIHRLLTPKQNASLSNTFHLQTMTTEPLFAWCNELDALLPF